MAKQREQSDDGSILHHLPHFDCRALSSPAPFLIPVGLDIWNERNISLEIVGRLVMLGVRYSPRIIGHEEK